MKSSNRVWVAILSVITVAAGLAPFRSEANPTAPTRLIRSRSNTTGGHYFDLMATLASSKIRELKLRELSRARGGAETVHSEETVATLGARAAALNAPLMEGPFGVDIAS